MRHLPGIRKLAQKQFPDTPFNLIGVDIDYNTLPFVFSVFRLEDLLNDPYRDFADHASRVHRLAVEKGRNDTILTRITLPKGGDEAIIKHIEVLISNADSFNVQKPVFGEKVPRLTGQDSESQELDVVAYDRIDEYFTSLVPGKYKLDDEALTQIIESLRPPEPDRSKPVTMQHTSQVLEMKKPADTASSGFTFTAPA